MLTRLSAAHKASSEIYECIFNKLKFPQNDGIDIAVAFGPSFTKNSE